MGSQMSTRPKGDDLRACNEPGKEGIASLDSFTKKLLESRGNETRNVFREARSKELVMQEELLSADDESSCGVSFSSDHSNSSPTTPLYSNYELQFSDITCLSQVRKNKFSSTFNGNYREEKTPRSVFSVEIKKTLPK